MTDNFSSFTAIALSGRSRPLYKLAAALMLVCTRIIEGIAIQYILALVLQNILGRSISS
ncbi:hypothetical protein [Spirulina sp. 06S082]|uniref:hypothetical protein n=1 Tax=Spirulina sp. 06S082 TaxID=3110248 RepID=UPI002B1FA8BD|nr:hypothetical protein [Spirulina sp. 06S082]MEA5470612.1 hypothetical protein [Spirulina sp. 06S082]